MKLSIAIAVFSTANAAAIAKANQNKDLELLSNDISVMQENGDEKMKLPDWFVTFNNYLELEDESEFDLDEFLDELQDSEVQDLSFLLYLMEGGELSDYKLSADKIEESKEESLQPVQEV